MIHFRQQESRKMHRLYNRKNLHLGHNLEHCWRNRTKMRYKKIKSRCPLKTSTYLEFVEVLKSLHVDRDIVLFIFTTISHFSKANIAA